VSVYGQLPPDARRLFDLVAANYLAAVMPDYEYKLTTITLDVAGAKFKAHSEVPVVMGWMAVYVDKVKTKYEAGQARLSKIKIQKRRTEPPRRYSEGTLVEAMENAWQFIEDKNLKERLKKSNGIGTPATRAKIIEGLKVQNLIRTDSTIVTPTTAGMELYRTLKIMTPKLIDPAVTAILEMQLDEVVLGRRQAIAVVDGIAAEASKIIMRLKSHKGTVTIKPSAIASNNKGGCTGFRKTPPHCRQQPLGKDGTRPWTH
jgi:DNA topoisomerase-3